MLSFHDVFAVVPVRETNEGKIMVKDLAVGCTLVAAVPHFMGSWMNASLLTMQCYCLLLWQYRCWEANQSMTRKRDGQSMTRKRDGAAKPSRHEGATSCARKNRKPALNRQDSPIALFMQAEQRFVGQHRYRWLVLATAAACCLILNSAFVSAFSIPSFAIDRQSRSRSTSRLGIPQAKAPFPWVQSHSSQSQSQSHPHPHPPLCNFIHYMISPSMTSDFRIELHEHWDKDDDGDNSQDKDHEQELASHRLLDYLPDKGLWIPPLTRRLVEQLTQHYIYGGIDHPIRDIAFCLTLRDVQRVMRTEFQSLDVPVIVANWMFDVTQSGQERDEAVAEVLSLAAYCRLPCEICQALLDCITPNATTGTSHNQTLLPVSLLPSSSSLAQCRQAFAVAGWESVSFPQGLALRLKRDLNNQQQQRWQEPSGLGLRRMRRRARAAAQLVQEAQTTLAPLKQTKTPLQFLADMQAELDAMEPLPIISSQSSQAPSTFFPSQSQATRLVPWHRFTLKAIRRTVKRKYAFLKERGRAGFVSYCFFNFLFYTLGVAIQWSRVAPVDPVTAAMSSSSPSSTNLFLVCLRKLGRVFASLYVASQFLKIPKLFAAVALLPSAEQSLHWTQRQFHLSENRATIVMAITMVLVWLAFVAIPFTSDYAHLRRTL